MTDHYRTLGVAPDADEDVIRAAYVALMRKHHPDGSGADKADDRAKAINAAFDVLRDPQQRAAYDRTLRGAGRSPLYAEVAHPQYRPWRRAPTGPTLAARRKRLQRVRLFTALLLVAACLLTITSIIAITVMVRPELLATLSN